MFEKLTKMNDKLTKTALKKQISDTSSSYDGGIIDEKTGIPSPSHVGTAGTIVGWISSLLNPSSKYYLDEALVQNTESSLNYMLKKQNADGTISPLYTNFNSPPDTAFVVIGFSQAFLLINDTNHDILKSIEQKFHLFLERSVPALLTGGCHTPNHRWVLTAALAYLYKVFKRPELVTRAEEWLEEGIDITEDGEWTERSNGIYNTVSDITLYYTSKLLNLPQLLDAVRKNLEMVVYLIHPNGEVVTDYSGRQDFGKSHNLSQYHLVYRLMAVNDENPLFLAMSELAIENLKDMGPANNHIMMGHLFFSSLGKIEIEEGEIPTKYERVINENYPYLDYLKKKKEMKSYGELKHSSMHTSFGAPVVRYREEEISSTIMTKSNSFFSVRNGDASLLGMQLRSAFSPGVIEFEKLNKTPSGYFLSARQEKGYYSPVSKKDIKVNKLNNPDNVWYLLPHHLRPLTHNQSLDFDAKITKLESREFEINLKSKDKSDVLTQLIFLFDKKGTFKSEKEDLAPLNNNKFLWKGGTISYELNNYSIEINSGAYQHWLEGPSATEFGDVKVLLVNLVTPFEKRIRISLK